jgi:hypothetical protein
MRGSFRCRCSKDQRAPGSLMRSSWERTSPTKSSRQSPRRVEVVVDLESRSCFLKVEPAVAKG